MTDRELLQLAAKAYASPNIRMLNFGDWFDDEREKYWNPLYRDGDALRLAVKLGIKISCRKDTGVGKWAIASCWAGCFKVDATTDPDSASRRAIVIAAANIGKLQR